MYLSLLKLNISKVHWPVKQKNYMKKKIFSPIVAIIEFAATE